jgi:hypothetical protein
VQKVQKSERNDLFVIPFLSWAATALMVAAAIDVQLASPPPGWRAALRRAWRRLRPLATPGSWRRAQWRAARGLYDGARVVVSHRARWHVQARACAFAGDR